MKTLKKRLKKMKVGEIKTLYIMNKFQVFLADNWLRIEKLGKKNI